MTLLYSLLLKKKNSITITFQLIVEQKSGAPNGNIVQNHLNMLKHSIVKVLLVFKR